MTEQKRIHEVCSWCSKECKKPYTFWSGMLSPWEYCDDFDESLEYKQLDIKNYGEREE